MRRGDAGGSISADGARGDGSIDVTRGKIAVRKVPYLRHFSVCRGFDGNHAHRSVFVRENISEQIFGYQYHIHNLPVRGIDVWHDSSSGHSRGEGATSGEMDVKG